VSIGNDPNGSFEEANFKLVEGLRNCRAVVKSYRSLLAPEVGLHTAAENDSGIALDNFGADPADERQPAARARQ
jgi:hypothetical protein